MTHKDKLAELGFIKVGSWFLRDEKIGFELLSHKKGTDFLYTFVSGEEVLYIGKSTMSVYRRMMGYKNPGPTQRTNVRNHAQISEILSRGGDVAIYVLTDDQDFSYRGYKVNLAAGLEDTLIAEFSPRWNVRK